MADEGGKRNLGRGLSDLLGGAPTEPRHETIRTPRTLPIEQLHPGRFQPRRQFAAEAIEALAQSIRENGILQLRGKVLPCRLLEGVEVVPTFHPSYLLRGQLVEQPTFLADLRLAVSRLKR